MHSGVTYFGGVIDKQGKIAYLSVGYDEKEFAELIDTVAAQLKK